MDGRNRCVHETAANAALLDQSPGIRMNIVRFLRLAVVMMAGCCLTAPTVASAATAPGIVTPPASQVVFVGSNITFTVLATGTEPLRYQWRKGGINLGGNKGGSGSAA